VFNTWTLQRLKLSNMAPVSPFGRRLLPTLLDQIAAASPDRVYGRYPPANWHSKGYREITWSQFAKAVDKASYWLDASLGPAENFDTFAYSGSNDFRYAFLVLAAIKTGRKVCLKSPKLSIGAPTEHDDNDLLRFSSRMVEYQARGV
jgi:hypothetical protein